LTDSSSEIGSRLEHVRERIRGAALANGRDPNSIRLVAVSKHQPVERIRAAYAAGQRDFGESYLQEADRKLAELGDLPDLRIHLVGHLQRNKARLAARLIHVIHTIDSIPLAQDLARRAQARFASSGRPIEALIEVSIAGESQKAGVAPNELASLLKAVEGERELKLRGLMAIPPDTEDPAAALPYFEKLRAIRDAHGGTRRLPELSMGMSHDLEYAIAAGATIVRVGTAIFGARGA
jgi:pyridoxal phosphate enzyme (YggS family)